MGSLGITASPLQLGTLKEATSQPYSEHWPQFSRNRLFGSLRLPCALDLAHLVVAIFQVSEASSFTDIDRFSKNGEVQTRHQDPPSVGSPCHRESELVVSRGNHQYSVRVARCECIG